MRRPHALVASLALLLGASGCGYNQIQTLDERVNQAQGQIQTQLQRRADLIPNLVEVVKGVAKQESTIFTSIAESRARLSGAVQRGDVGEMAQANSQVSSDLGRLLAIVENYPQLRSNENFRDLQVQLEGTENRILRAREEYNKAAGEYNAALGKVRGKAVNKVTGTPFKPREFFKMDAGAAAAPKVSF